MIGVQCDHSLIACRHLDGNRSSGRRLQIDLITYVQFFGARQVLDRNFQDLIRIRHTVGLFRLKMNVHDLPDFHVGYRSVKAFDHHAGAADKFQRFISVVGRVELLAVVKGSAVMHAAGFIYISALQRASVRRAVAAVSVVAVVAFFTTLVPVAAMLSAFVSVAAMLMLTAVVMVAGRSCRNQLALQKCFHGLVGISFGAGYQLNTHVVKRILRARPDAAADQHVHLLVGKNPRQSSVSLSVGTDHLAGGYLIVFHVVNLEKLCSSKVLEDIAVVVSCCDFHYAFVLLFMYSPVSWASGY